MAKFEHLKWLTCLFLTALLSLILSHSVLGREILQPAQESSLGSESSHRLQSVEEFETFIDGVMAVHLQSRQIPAAVISVVKDGEIFFAKGYGYADRKKRTPVDPEKTLFRPGSISKLFTWTAVMQLAERGQLDLDADINQYLETFQIPSTYLEPITMKHLLTHTPGFEDGALGYLFIRSADELVPLNESLKAHIPWRVRPPGTYSSYSNYGTALAGLIVSNISGMSFDDFIEQNILQPLGMANCTFREPLSGDLAANMATGYEREGGAYKQGDFEFISNFGPAGSLSCSATDMARFMIMHLQRGRFGEQQLLKEETARQMHSQLYTLDPRLPGMAYGFYEARMNGQHMIGHGGDTRLFHSNLSLLPEHGVGLYVSYVANGGWARFELLKAFLDRYFPGPEQTALEASSDFQSRGQRFAGHYRFTRHNSSTIEKLVALALTLSVSVTEENRLLVQGVFPEPSQYVEVEPLLFQQVDGWQTIAFKEDAAGDVTHMFFGLLPFMPTYKISWYETQGFSLALVALGALLSITLLVSAFYLRKENKLASGKSRWAVRLAVLQSLLTLLFFVSFLVIAVVHGEEIVYGIPASLSAALVLPILTSILTLATVTFSILAWKSGYWTLVRRIHFSLFALVSIALVWFYYYWNILGFQY